MLEAVKKTDTKQGEGIMMKKYVAILCSVFFCVTSFAACSKDKPAENSPRPSASAAPSADGAQATDGTGSSSNTQTSGGTASNGAAASIPPQGTTVVDGKQLFIALSDGASTDVYYHLENCPLIQDKEKNLASVEVIQAIGFRPCETCKPPVLPVG